MPVDKERFVNARAEAYWTLRERFEQGRIILPDSPYTDRLTGELTGLQYKITSSGKIQIVSKEEMRRKGMASPDLADALAMAFSPGLARQGKRHSYADYIERRMSRRRRMA